MADRRSFLGAAVSGVAASVLLAAKAGAQAGAPEPPPATSPRPPASPSPAPSATPKPPSALALATATAMRRFDASLSDKDLDTIAHGIDDNRRGAARLNPNKATALKNGDEPVTRFAVARSPR
ncbi:MAG TPA: hypothetical protein VGX96_02900 [Candidatus Elarobacter sp.]|jgi:hypothetical protein|nr:hypothetical protein [Candidatus Elarobacter sp.]